VKEWNRSSGAKTPFDWKGDGDAVELVLARATPPGDRLRPSSGFVLAPEVAVLPTCVVRELFPERGRRCSREARSKPLAIPR